VVAETDTVLYYLCHNQSTVHVNIVVVFVLVNYDI